MISPADWERLKEIFTQALGMEGAERASFVEAACRRNPDLEEHLMRLLSAHECADEFLSVPAVASPVEADPQRQLFDPGQTLCGRYLIIRLIARGGMGDVYEVEDRVLGEKVALKAIWPDAASGLELERIKTEVQSARRVTHANVCRTYDIALQVDPPVTLLTMELLEGLTLSAHLREHGAFSKKEAIPIIRQICTGLQAAHDAGVIHRDFKPGNIILTGAPQRWHPVITDFGLALPAGMGTELPQIHGGTPGYMAPEQVEGKPITPATDIYSLGMVIARMTGALHPDGAIERPAASEASSRAAIADKRAGSWKRIINRCLDKDPAKRFQRPADVSAALDRAQWQRKHAGSLLGISALLIFCLSIPLFRHPTEGRTSISSQPQAQNPIAVTDAQPPGEVLSAPRPKPAEAFKRQIPLPKTDISVWKPAPDGRSLIITDYDPSAPHLALWDLETGKLRPATHSESSAAAADAFPEYPVFSPDGGRIAYRRGSELRTVRIGGSEDHVLYSDPAVQIAIPQDWSPDGQRILVGAFTGGKYVTLILSARDGSVLHSIPHNARIVDKALFYRDGARVICNAWWGEQKAEEIELIDPVTGREAPLMESPADDRIVGWTTDRSQLLFTSNRGGTTGLWTLPFSEGGVAAQPRELKPDMEGTQPVGLTSAGTLYYNLNRADRNVFTAEIDVESARTISNPKRVSLKFRGEQRYASWSPDGSKLAFYLVGGSVATAGSDVIWTRDTGDIQLVRNRSISVTSPQWLGTTGWLIGYGSDENDTRGYYKINTADNEARLAFELSAINKDGFAGIWSRDGTMCINRYSGGQKGLFRLTVASGERQTLYVPPAGCKLGLEALALSPDENWVAFQVVSSDSEASCLILVPTAGGEERTLWQINKPDVFWNGAFTWSRDGRYVIAARDRNGISEIWRVPVDGGDPKKIEFPETKRIAMLRMNPDGKTIAFVAGEQPKTELWVLENFLTAGKNAARR